MAKVKKGNQKPTKSIILPYKKTFGKQDVELCNASGISGTTDNCSEYIQYACENSKKLLDNIGINEYNVNETSQYNKDKYLQHRYDETFAEWAEINAMKGKQHV